MLPITKEENMKILHIPKEEEKNALAGTDRDSCVTPLGQSNHKLEVMVCKEGADNALALSILQVAGRE